MLHYVNIDVASDLNKRKARAGAADLLTPGTHIIMSEYWLLSRKRMLKKPRVAQNQLIRTIRTANVLGLLCYKLRPHKKQTEQKQ